VTCGRTITLLATLALVATAVPESAATRPRAAAHTTRQAERNVLRVLSRVWPNLLRDVNLVDTRSRLLRDNVHAICRAAGRHSGRRSRALYCSVRAGVATSSASLYVKYRVLERRGFRLRLIGLMRR
jgi:hypothetical protein